MGQRDRRDPAAHKKRGKGRPTPEAPAGDAPREEVRVEWAPPATYLEFFIQAAEATVSKPEGAPIEFLDLKFLTLEGAEVVVRCPVDGAPGLVGTIAHAIKKWQDEKGATPPSEQRTEGGVILPGLTTDVDAEAKAHQQIRDGGDAK